MSATIANNSKRLLLILATAVGLLMIPLIATQFSDEVDWNAFDFMVMGTLLLITGLTIEFVLRKVRTANGRFLLILGIVILFLLIWAELAVGIFGTPFAGS